jgi:hypothetical protein
MIASFAAAIVSAGAGLAAIWDHAGYNVGASLLALLTPLLALRVEPDVIAGSGRFSDRSSSSGCAS